MKKNIFKISICVVVLIGLLTIGYFTINEQSIDIKLNGDSEIEVEVFDKYKELGVQVAGTKKKYTISGSVNTAKLGKYTITYNVKSILNHSIKRKINVVDKTKPEITLTGGDITIYTSEQFSEPGFTAIDNYDKDLTSKVTVTNNVNTAKVGEYEITYTVEDSSKNKAIATRKVIVKEKVVVTSGLTYINGILLVNKQYSVPSTYNPGVDATADAALKQLQQAAATSGYNIPLLSGFRSYSRQNTIYNNYVKRDGQAQADTYSAKPGHSEHQTGLAFDVGALDGNYGETPEGQWLAQNAHTYGFIIRYPKDKTHITGYMYEPWHIRYVGIEHATNIYSQNITLEEYLGVY